MRRYPIPKAVILQLRHDSDEFDDALRAKVRAERINDVLAKETTKRYQEYLQLMQAQYMGEPEHDPNDQYRESDERLRLIGNALRTYRDRHDTTVKGGMVFLMNDFPIASAPHGVDSEAVLLQVHVRERLETFEQAVERGPDDSMRRVSLAQMAVTGYRYALQIDYYEDAERHIRELVEHVVPFDKARAMQLLDKLLIFAAKSRFEATEELRKVG